MDRLIFTAMSALKQLDSMKLKNSNALANASTVGFKETLPSRLRQLKLLEPALTLALFP